MTRKDTLLLRAEQYAHQNGVLLGDELGSGVHGIVLVAENQTKAGGREPRAAIKIHEHESDFLRERDIYLRLRQHAVKKIRDCHVPQLLRYDDALRVLEITIVKRPFVLDFAGAYLDRAPDFPEEVWDDWRADKAEQFSDHWPEVQAILRELESYGIYMEDVSPGNISFGD